MSLNHNLEHTELVRFNPGTGQAIRTGRALQNQMASTTGPSAPTDSDSAALISWVHAPRVDTRAGNFSRIEVKTGAGQLSRKQDAWHRAATAAQCIVFVARSVEEVWKRSNNEFVVDLSRMRLLFPDGDHVRDAQAIGLE